jgi:hypothetical protein
MVKRPTKPKAGPPVDVRVVALPEELSGLLKDLPKRIAELESREAKLTQRVADLEGRIAALQEDASRVRLGGGRPVTAYDAPGAGAAEENDLVDVNEMVSSLGNDIFGALPEDGAFTVQDVDIDLAGAAGLDKGAGRSTLGLNPRRAVTGDTATRVKFTLRRRAKTKVVK